MGSEGGGAAPPRSTVKNPDGSMRPRVVATSETWVAPSLAIAITASGSGRGMITSGVAVRRARVTTESPPM